MGGPLITEGMAAGSSRIDRSGDARGAGTIPTGSNRRDPALAPPLSVARVLRHRELPGRRTEREGRIDPRELHFVELEVSGGGVLGRMLGARGLGVREKRGPPHGERECHMAWSLVMGGIDHAV